MNHIEQAYQQGLKIRNKDWSKIGWIKKYSSTQSIDESGDFWTNDYFDFETHPDNWEIFNAQN